MSEYGCTAYYHDDNGCEGEVDFLLAEQTEGAVEKALAEYDSDAELYDHEWTGGPDEYGCRVFYYSDRGSDTDTHVTVFAKTEDAVKKAVKEEDYNFAPRFGFDIFWDDEGCYECVVNYGQAGEGQEAVAHLRVKEKSESAIYEALRQGDYGCDEAYGIYSVVWEDEEEERLEEEAAAEARKIVVEWSDKQDVINAFLRCAGVLAKDFDMSPPDLVGVIRENMVEGVMES